MWPLKTSKSPLVFIPDYPEFLFTTIQKNQTQITEFSYLGFCILESMPGDSPPF
jgi:hypothetical protein